MRNINFNRVVKATLLLFGIALSTTTFGQVDVVATAGTPIASYTTLKGAFDAINAGTHQGNIGIGISANTTETAPAVLNSSGAGTALYTSVLIQPVNDGVSISGATTTGRGLIELKGADNVTINGDNPNTPGTNRDLTITNTAANTVTLTSVIRIATAATVVTSADNNSILNCILNGSATGRNIAAATSTTGTENNTFGIYVGGNGGTTDIDAPAALTSVTTNTAVTGTTVNALVLSNNTINAAARGIVFNGAAAGVSTGVTITNNLIGDQLTTLVGNAPYTTPTTTVYTKGIFIAGTTSLAITGNTIKNIISYVATATNAIELNSAIAAAGGSVDVSNNTIIGVATNNTSGAAANAILFSSCTQPYTINNNTITTIQTVASASAAGINLATTAANGSVSLNRISNVYALSTGGYAARGIFANGGNNVTIQNNTIWDLKAANNNSITSTAFAVKGISLASGNGHKVYHNTVNLFGPMLSANTFADNTTCLIIVSSSQTGIDIRNNIFSNTMTGDPATAHGCIQLPSGASAAMNLTLNNNAYYKGSAANSYYAILQSAFTGYNNLLTMRAYTSTLSAAGTNDNASIASTTAAPFVSSSDLHINTGVTPTQLESGGATVGVTTDIDGQNRPGPTGSVNGGATAPDMGADEFDGAPLTAPTVTLNSVTPPTTSQCTATARLVSVNVANTSGTVVSVNLAYTINGAAQAPIAMVNTLGTTWEATIPVPAPANATIAWGVSATNSFALSGTYTGTSYSDEPVTGVTASASATPATICAGSPTSISAALTRVGTATIGTATTLTGATSQPTAFCNRWPSYRMQTVYTAAELTAAGLTAGPITSISYTITTLGDGATNANYTVRVGTTGLSAFTDFISNAGFTTVFPAATYTHAIGVNTVTFSTPYVWDGTSNLVVEVSHDGANATNNSQTFYTTTAANTVAWSTSGGAVGTPSNQRLNVTFGGNTTLAISGISWSDGVGTVGTTNPLTVNPTATTTYTATITSSGCPVTPSPTTTVTVNPLPSAPTATNSAQCGTQVPTASVTSTTAQITPTFIWYDAAVAGTALQTSTSTTFTSNVAATTTFYVSEVDGVTGCESARTPVTVTVAIADGVSASTSSPTICIGSSITLTAANTNPTPNQSYSYTWSSTANSGASTPVAGSPAIITPTQPGTYTYNLTAVDGGCNAVATVDVTVNPFVATLAPINVTCNGYNNGSFSVASSSCGTLPYSYSVNSGPFDVIPTNLAPGTYSVVVQDDNGYLVAAQNVVITEPNTTIAAPTGTNASVCQGDLNAPVTATSVTNTPTPASVVVNFSIATQPTELSASTVPATVAASPNAIATATMAALPAGAIVTGATLNYNNIVATGNSWQSDVRLGLVGAVSQNYTAGTGTVNNAGTFNYVSTIPAGSVNVAGGTITMHYFDFFNDNAAGTESTFPTGTDVASITINYTVPTPASITWWDAASAGTQIGAGSPFETVGTSVLPNTNTPGVYTVYAQGEFGGCNGLTRTPVTVTVNAPSSSTTTITACGSYMWTNGTTYTASGIHTQTLVNAAGCDSIATLNLTINQPTSSTVTVTACGSYTWAENATTYNTSGSYQVVLAGANAVGCDSTVTLNLTINQPTSSTVTVTACGSYTWAQNTTTYTTSGSYPVVLAGANANGCDSTITLNLTINQPTSSTVTVSACGSYTWAENTTTYTTSGSYPVVLAGANANGCDSTITLNLTINQPTSSTVTEVACGSYTWTENNTTYTASGSYTVVLAGANANGCDSTITLNLTINQPTSSTVAVTECESYYWALSDSTYTASGSYDVVLANANAVGCDSTVTLNLTINQPTTSTLTATECESFYWALSDSTYTASGSYQVVLAGANANGCDSIATLVLTITGNPVATATDNDDATITASAGATYQWINCATNTAIAGATSQTYTATANGDYAVVVTNAGGCSDTSSCVTIDYIGLTEITDASIQVFPNPTNSDVTITMTAAEATVEVVDAQGKLLQAVTVGNGEKVTLSSYETGVYFLRIRTANGSTLERVVKQ